MQTTCKRFFAMAATAAMTASGLAQVETRSLGERMEEVMRMKIEQSADGRFTLRQELSPRERVLQKLYYTDLTVDFDGTRAQDAFNFFENALGVNVTVRFLDEQHLSGIDPETPITLDVENANALDVLEMMLDQCAVDEPCTWQLRSSFLEVGTKERLAGEGAQEIRVYPVGDLLYEAPDFYGAPPLLLEDVYRESYLYGPYGYGYGGFGWGGYGGGVLPGGFEPSMRGRGRLQTGAFTDYDAGYRDTRREETDSREDNAAELIDTITTMIEPDMWTRNGGSGASLRIVEENILVVRAPDFIHRQIGGYPKVPSPAQTARPPQEDDGADD